ncbi:hypothetical protein JYT31_01150 [Beggiatoa alba]|nr:hypothetical protein [Beggiatoa alba]
MDENEYRSAYSRIISVKCVYEKAINSRQTSCEQSNKIRLADREAVACRSKEACNLCTSFLEILRTKSLFALKLQDHSGPLPHAKEIKVQMGSIIGLALDNAIEIIKGQKIENIYRLLSTSLSKYKTLENLPYENLIRSIVNYDGRPKRKSRKK